MRRLGKHGFDLICGQQAKSEDTVAKHAAVRVLVRDSPTNVFLRNQPFGAEESSNVHQLCSDYNFHSKVDCGSLSKNGLRKMKKARVVSRLKEKNFLALGIL
ncbi:MAG: hypothetical protein ACRBM6_09890 [Geminicoccales bacterium]